MVNPRWTQTSLSDFEPATFAQDEVFCWNSNLFELHLRMTVRSICMNSVSF